MIEKIERTIRYFGILRPPADIKNIKWWRLTADIIKPPLSIYRNDRYLTPYGFWGYVQSMYADRVLHTYRVSYENELIAYNINTDLFIHQSVSCHLEAMLSSFVNLGLWVRPGFVLERNNPIKEWVNLTMPIQEFRIKLLTEDTIYKFTYEYEVQENCEVPESSPPSPPPPPPPPPPTPFPPATPGNELPPISDAYDGNDDGGLTYKPEEDRPDYPIGEACEVFIIEFKVRIASGSTSQETILGGAFYGPIENIFLKTPDPNNPTINEIIVVSRGNAQFNSCQATVGEYGGIAQNNIISFDVVSITKQLPT